jgi:hypothetical protein
MRYLKKRRQCRPRQNPIWRPADEPIERALDNFSGASLKSFPPNRTILALSCLHRFLPITTVSDGTRLRAARFGVGPGNLAEGFNEGARRLRTGKRGDAVQEKVRHAI